MQRSFARGAYYRVHQWLERRRLRTAVKDWARVSCQVKMARKLRFSRKVRFA